jgi:hypothetical protein
MGKYDKDRFQKEISIRYCLARGMVPFLEVVVPSTSDLSDSVEVLTDIDVLGLEAAGDGDLRRTIFDCKNTNKMSAINRAFWAAGVKEYTACDEALVILRSKAVHNHRISALKLNVDLHDEHSFRNLGRTADESFPADRYYQSSIERWNDVYDCYGKNVWSKNLFDLVRNVTPITQAPWSAFRRILAELRAVHGEFDPNKDAHRVIFLDILASSLVLWAALGRSIRRFYEPSMEKGVFERTLRYYLWGGKDSYSIRQQMREKSGSDNEVPVELPAWNALQSFVGLIVSAPQNILECAHVCRELSIMTATGTNSDFDKALSVRIKTNSRVRQFSASLSDYFISAGKLPNDLGENIQRILFSI